MGLLDGFEKLINEHGSSTILKERIVLANDKYAALERKLSECEAAKINLNSENEALRLDNEQLKQQNRALEEKLSHNLSLVFDDSTGTYIEESSQVRYCQVCRDAHNRNTRLRNDAHGWYCQVCKRAFDDPARPYPRMTFGPPLA
jgi:FtsZ-binding cell division protein ZapB